MNELPGIPMPYTVEVDGRTWDLFSVDFDTADGKFSTYIYALSFEHAEMLVQEMKLTARVSGQIIGAYD